jgi:hypothetical protein
MVNIFLWPSTSEYLPTQATAWAVASERIIQSDGDVEKHLGRNTAAYVIVLHKYVNILIPAEKSFKTIVQRSAKV